MNRSNTNPHVGALGNLVFVPKETAEAIAARKPRKGAYSYTDEHGYTRFVPSCR